MICTTSKCSALRAARLNSAGHHSPIGTQADIVCAVTRLRDVLCAHRPLRICACCLLWQGAVAVFGCLSFIVGYAIGFGAVGWTYVSEVVPSRLRYATCIIRTTAAFCDVLLIVMSLLSTNAQTAPLL
eukprot:2211-Heterococcus_DN1.PRE.5